MADGKSESSGTFKELGVTGLNHQGGVIDEEFLRALSTKDRRIKIWNEMGDNDPVIGAILFTIEMLMRQVQWRVEPAAAGGAASLEAAAFLRSCMDDMQSTWADTLSSVFTFLQYGHSVHEEVFKKRDGASDDPRLHSAEDDGRIGWRKLAPRAQDTIESWVMDEHGDILGIKQVAPPDFKVVPIPSSRFLLFRTTAKKNNPEGRSILRNAYRPWYFKKRIEEIEGIGIERDLAGLPVAWVPASILSTTASAADKAALTQMKKLVTQIRRDEREGAVFPLSYDANGNKLYDLTLLSSGGTRQFDTNQIVSRYDSRIAMTTLADFIIMGHEKVGSYALADSKTNLFATAIGSWMASVAEVFNRVAIPRLFALNTFSPEVTPSLAHDDIETVDLKQLGDLISKLSLAGADLLPDPVLEAWVRDQAGMPPAPATSGGEVTPPPPKPASKAGQGDGGEGGSE